MALAKKQQGVVACRQLLALGCTRALVRQLVDEGWLVRIYQGVYVVGGHTLTRKGHWMAAVLACGPDALLSHFNAAALWGIRDTNQRKIDVTVPHAHRLCRPTLRVHSTRTIHREDIDTVDGIPVTSLARTLIDIAARLRTDGPLTRAIEAAERLEIFDLRAVDRTIARSPRRPGVKRLKAVLAAYRPAPDFRSKSERRLHGHLRKAGFPPPLTNTMIAGVEADFYWPEYRLVIEFDGRPYHSSPRNFETDRIKDAILQRAGCAILRVTEERVSNDLAGILDDARTLAQRPRAA